MKTIFLALLSVLFLAIQATACICIYKKPTRKSVKTSYKFQSVIFIGHVESITPSYFKKKVYTRSPFSNQDTVYLVDSEHISANKYTFAVSKLFKGKLVGSTMDIWDYGGSCGTSFLENEEYLVFGILNRDSTAYITDACKGNMPLRLTTPLQLRMLNHLARNN